MLNLSLYWKTKSTHRLFMSYSEGLHPIFLLLFRKLEGAKWSFFLCSPCKLISAELDFGNVYTSHAGIWDHICLQRRTFHAIVLHMDGTAQSLSGPAPPKQLFGLSDVKYNSKVTLNVIFCSILNNDRAEKLNLNASLLPVQNGGPENWNHDGNLVMWLNKKEPL